MGKCYFCGTESNLNNRGVCSRCHVIKSESREVINNYPLNGFCKGADLGDGNFTGCSCDCPACEDAYNRALAAETALVSLTPGGSEFCNDIEACVKWIKFKHGHLSRRIITAIKMQEAAETALAVEQAKLFTQQDKNSELEQQLSERDKEVEIKIIKESEVELLDDDINEDDKVISQLICECTNCHWRFIGDCYRFGYGYTSQGTQIPNYCPMCGGKITDDIANDALTTSASGERDKMRELRQTVLDACGHTHNCKDCNAECGCRECRTIAIAALGREGKEGKT